MWFVLGKIYFINFWQSGKDSGSQNDFLIKLPEPQRAETLAEKQKYFVFGLAKNFKIQLKIMRALWQIGGFSDVAGERGTEAYGISWLAACKMKYKPESSIKKASKLATATVSPVILCKIVLKITAKENLHIIWLKSYTHLLWRQRQRQLCSTLWENE